MPSDTNAEDRLPSASRSSAQPKATAGFQSYAKYLANLERTPKYERSNSTENLWLASFTENGRCIRWYYCCPFDESAPSTPIHLPTVDESRTRSDTLALSSSEFQTLLQTTDKNVAYRVIIATIGFEERYSRTKDILGLGLDLEPEVFDYVESRADYTKLSPKDRLPLPWFRDCPALRIGEHVLCILEATLGRTSETGICEDTTLTI
jgi:hypothetical protein